MNIVFKIFYEITLILLILVSLPFLLYKFLFKKKYRNSFKHRFCAPSFPWDPKTKQSIWIHAVSMGELKSILVLARTLKRLYPKYALVISTTTETAHAEAKRSLVFADAIVYLPFDFLFTVSRAVKKANPKLVILAESDFWYNFLSVAKQQGARLAVVSGKLSHRSASRFALAPFFSKRLFNLFELICTQNDTYRQRFIHAGADPEKVLVTGNLKFDDEYPQLTNDELIQWRDKLGIAPNQLVITVGSTHSPEEQICIDILKKLWKNSPGIKVIIVPRHPERFKEVVRLLETERVSFIPFTDINRKTGNEQVILMDAMGMLRMCYQLADIAIVGGSFTEKVGGHNILEPCFYGKPVLFGPHMHTQLELLHYVKQAGAGLQVSQDELKGVLQSWIEHPLERQSVGNKGLQLISELKGSNNRTLKALEPLFSDL